MRAGGRANTRIGLASLALVLAWVGGADGTRFEALAPPLPPNHPRPPPSSAAIFAGPRNSSFLGLPARPRLGRSLAPPWLGRQRAPRPSIAPPAGERGAGGGGRLAASAASRLFNAGGGNGAVARGAGAAQARLAAPGGAPLTARTAEIPVELIRLTHLCVLAGSLLRSAMSWRRHHGADGWSAWHGL